MTPVADRQPSPGTYLGLSLVAMATVMYEITLTRIFSVTMWYHFAFVAISVAMFGMTVGALIVYLRPGTFTAARVVAQLGAGALLFAVAVVVSFLTHVSVPFAIDFSIVGIYTAALTYAAVALPFVASGVCVCLALTRFPGRVGALYAADLLGAALGCLLVIVTLDATDGGTTVFVVAALAAVAAVCFVIGTDQRRLTAVALLAVIALAALVTTGAASAAAQSPLVRLRWVKGAFEPPPLYERWNSFSRITVSGDPARPTPPFGWGLSSLTPVRAVPQLMLLIDASAGTVLTGFDGRLDELDHLKYDVTNVPHYLRSDAKVLVIGTGGGRDILSALAFGQRSVVGVEVNRAIIDVVNEDFGAFTGHLDRDPRVRFVNDEARSYVARQDDRFDIVQISVIDTWAATGAGAFVLTEHSLYTAEAFTLFLDHLTPGGVLAVSRYYLPTRPDEMYRLTSLATEVLLRRGIRDPRRHVMIVSQVGPRGGRPAPVGVATLLVSPTAFSDADVDTLDAVARRMAFDVLLSPRTAPVDGFARLASAADHDRFVAAYPANISAPTDDSPFFFHTLRVRDVFNADRWRGAPVDPVNMKAISVLGSLFVAVLGLTGLCVILPLFLSAERVSVRQHAPILVFFAAIGIGFMLVEISQMERLIIFLGHPTYGLSVVLFALLASSGLGSALVGWLPAAVHRRGVPLLFLLAVLVAFGVATPIAIHAWPGATNPVRILVAVALLFPIGLLMGMAFPLGMERAAATESAPLTPWLWSINGATSVCASVLALLIALSAGIAASFWTGVASYVVATAAFLLAPCAGEDRAHGG